MLEVIPVTARRQRAKFDLYDAVTRSILDCGARLSEGDVVIISTKYVSVSQGRLLDARDIAISSEAAALSREYMLDGSIAEVILRESERVLGGTCGFVLAAAGGMLAPNAGIDRSNAGGGAIIPYPADAYHIAEQMQRKIFLNQSVHVGIILSDSRIMPARVGTSGVAVACAGIEPVTDMRARPDLDGAPLKVTLMAVADNLASIATHSMGEGAESKPIVIIRNSGARLTHRRISPGETAVPHDQCVYIRGLGVGRVPSAMTLHSIYERAPAPDDHHD